MMNEAAVFVTRLIHDAGIALLADAGVAARMNPQFRPPRHDEMVRIAAGHDAILCQLRDRIDEPVLRAAQGRCKIIATCAAGYDNIDVAAARRLGIIITHTPDVLTEATADLTWALLLAAARRIGEAERYLRAGAWRGWGMLDFLGAEVHGRTLGIVGAGRIGTAVARRASGFSMPLVYHSRTSSSAMEELGGRRVPLAELVATSDFVSIHVPCGEATRRMIDAKALARMKRTAILVNTSRGEVVDQKALIEALREGRIAAAGLDVYENEPRVPAELIALENVVLLPHIGSATEASRRRMAETAARNIIAVLRGQPPLNPVPA
jgi:glyoxylate reductase